MPAKILCTIGPASLNRRTLSRLEAMGVSLFRINLSHTALEDVDGVIAFLQAHSSVPVCLDSEGAQVRTGPATVPVRLVDNGFVDFLSETVPGEDSRLTLTPPQAVGQLRRGDIVTLDFNGAAAQVVAVADGVAHARVVNGGLVGTNKAVSVDREIELPAISPKDRGAIAIGLARGVRVFALSFAGSGEDVEAMRALVGPDSTVISKIESLSGLANLDTIATGSDAILIDRGDMSRQVPIERIPAIQKSIIRRVHHLDRPVYVATNLLESMIHASSPTRAEVNDVFNTLADGADGLVLAAETAIGAWPIQCVAMISRVAHEFAHRNDPPGAGFACLPEPNGGALVNQISTATPDDLARLPALVVSERALMDAEQIAVGAFSPITGFMDSETLDSVLREYRTPAGAPWTMPILLPIAASTATPGPGERLRLVSASGTTHSVVEVSEDFERDLTALSGAWFGTASADHPGVARLLAGGGRFLAGRVHLVQPLDHPQARFTLSPAQARQVFERKGWNRVVAFHGRSVVHRAHEYIQLEALERTDADGLLLHPLVGPGRPGDFEPSAVLASYETCLAAGVYPSGRAILAGFASYPRFAGPRETVFASLVQRNFGCSHFVIGRDMGGMPGGYAPDASRRLFDQMGDIGVAPVFFDSVRWEPTQRRFIETIDHTDEGIAGPASVRDSLGEGRELPDWVIRTEVQAMLRTRVAAGQDIFVP